MLQVELCIIMYVMNPMYIYDCNRQNTHILKENVCVRVHLHCILDPGLVSYVINHYPYFHFLHLILS